MIILGINAYHGDSSAALVIDGKIVNAIEEERINRIKHWAGLPVESIKWCLSDAGIDISKIDYIAVSRNPNAHLHKKILRVLKHTPSFDFLKGRLSNVARVSDIKSQLATALGIDESVIKAKVENVEHHMAHLGSTFFVSPFKEAACISVDGFGDFVSTMRGIGKKNEIKILDCVEFPHSLGIFYTAMTQFLGFLNYGDEYKVMGLSAYGKPKHLDKLRTILHLQADGLFKLDTSSFLHDKEGVEMIWENGKPVIGALYSNKLVELLGKPRKQGEEVNQYHQDLSASIQAIYEEAFFYILNNTYEKMQLPNLALAGGCIQNSLANGKITQRTPFKKLYIPPAAYDAGTSIGAAMVVWNKYCDKPKSSEFLMDHSYFGPSFTNSEIENEMKSYSDQFDKLKCKTKRYENEALLCKEVAQYIANAMIIGWFQGRTELGPRALGNRSILADPRNPEMKDILNARVKKREWFRPFAPSILEEKTGEWFEQSESVPFMERVYKIKDSKQDLIPAVCHIDATGRLQTVSHKTNPRYHKLIRAFEEITGVPIVLNTSFNDNEPIVNTPRDAIECFLSTKMDVLVLENFIIIKNVE